MTRVVVADDNTDIRELVTLKLTQAGYEVLPARDGAEALELVRRTRPDVAVLDVMMPAKSGIDVCREMRADEGTAAIPVLLLTAKAQTSDVVTGFGAGADAYMCKPFSPRELLSQVKTLLTSRAG
jgi:two-component system response regulator MtrA